MDLSLGCPDLSGVTMQWCDSQGWHCRKRDWNWGNSPQKSLCSSEPGEEDISPEPEAMLALSGFQGFILCDVCPIPLWAFIFYTHGVLWKWVPKIWVVLSKMSSVSPSSSRMKWTFFLLYWLFDAILNVIGFCCGRFSLQSLSMSLGKANPSKGNL